MHVYFTALQVIFSSWSTIEYNLIFSFRVSFIYRLEDPLFWRPRGREGQQSVGRATSEWAVCTGLLLLLLLLLLLYNGQRV